MATEGRDYVQRGYRREELNGRDYKKEELHVKSTNAIAETFQFPEKKKIPSIIPNKRH